MQFKVPQFIDIEDKVFGPLTFRQFIYLAGGAGFGYLAFHFLPTIFAIFVAPAVVAFALALAFMKYNDKPFIHVVESFIKYYTHSRLYLWHKEAPKAADPKDSKRSFVSLSAAPAAGSRATLTESNLKTLSWSLNVID